MDSDTELMLTRLRLQQELKQIEEAQTLTEEADYWQREEALAED